MAATLTINGHEAVPDPALSLFEAAERIGVRVPTSCVKNGKCRECVVEVTVGADALSPRTASERHLDGRFRLACQTHVAADRGRIECHTMRRGQMRIERHALELPARHDRPLLDPAVTRDGAWVL